MASIDKIRGQGIPLAANFVKTEGYGFRQSLFGKQILQVEDLYQKQNQHGVGAGGYYVSCRDATREETDAFLLKYPELFEKGNA